MTKREYISNKPFAGVSYFACKFENKDKEINVRDAVNSKIKPVQKALTLTWDGAARAGRPGAMLPSLRGRLAGEGDVPRRRRRAATAGRAAGAARAPARGGRRRRRRTDRSGGDSGPLDCTIVTFLFACFELEEIRSYRKLPEA